MAVFNQRFEKFSSGEQVLHFAAFLLVALTMGLMLTPAAYHRHVERRIVSERFVKMSSRLLTWSLVPFLIGICLDTYLIGRIILTETVPALAAGIGMSNPANASSCPLAMSASHAGDPARRNGQLSRASSAASPRIADLLLWKRRFEPYQPLHGL